MGVDILCESFDLFSLKQIFQNDVYCNCDCRLKG